MSGSVQQAVLRRILKANGKCSVAAYYGVSKLAGYRDFDLLYQTFTRAVPVQSPKAWAEALGKMVQPPGQPIAQVLQSPNLVSRAKPLAIVPWRGQAAPLDGHVADDFLAAEKHIKARLGEQGLAVKGSFFYLGEAEPLKRVGQVPVMGFHTAVDMRRGWFRQRWTLPRMAGLSEQNGNRLQGFACMLDQLRQHGREVAVLVAHPKTLIDFALYISQQESRFVPLRELVPNLQLYAFSGYDIALQRTELAYVLGGLPNLKWMQWYYGPSGVLAWQEDVNIRQRLRLKDDGAVFYEFVPVEDVHADGRFVRNYRRLPAHKVEAGREYLLVVSNMSGLLAVSTGQIVKVLQAEPLTVALKGPVVRLCGLGESFREDGVLEALANINMALVNHGVFVREALFGHNVAERTPQWLVEVSRPLGEVAPELLASVAKRLHAEMELRFEPYRAGCKGGQIRPPKVHVVPMGSFAAAQTMAPEFGHFDHSADAALVRRILSVAWQSQAFEGA
ncbi:MAG: GH3 auxin-responsive promoter family protein [Pseudomonadaceae bacterium]|nr:GH3 auxin-responsive promoter family protein [Pseudomonadaceae bacterium]